MSRLREVNRERGPLIGYGLQVENYVTEPMFCRSGIWVGARYHSAESVTITIDPWWPSQQFAFGIDSWDPVFYPFRDDEYLGPRPVPGSHAVSYGGHRDDPRSITLSIAPGADPEYHSIMAVYPFAWGAEPASRTPAQTMDVYLSGYEVHWSAENLNQEAACWRDFHHDLRVAVDHLVPDALFGTPRDPGPVELGLRSLRGDGVTAVRAALAEIRRRESAGLRDPFTDALRAGLAQTILDAAEPHLSEERFARAAPPPAPPDRGGDRPPRMRPARGYNPFRPPPGRPHSRQGTPLPPDDGPPRGPGQGGEPHDPYPAGHRLPRPPRLARNYDTDEPEPTRAAPRVPLPDETPGGPPPGPVDPGDGSWSPGEKVDSTDNGSPPPHPAVEDLTVHGLPLAEQPSPATPQGPDGTPHVPEGTSYGSDITPRGPEVTPHGSDPAPTEEESAPTEDTTRSPEPDDRP